MEKKQPGYQQSTELQKNYEINIKREKQLEKKIEI